MTPEEFAARLSAIPEEEPDEIDLAMLAEAESINDDSVMSLDDFNLGMNAKQVVLHIPLSLHRTLQEAADREGISLKQYMLYKLSQ